MIDFTRGELGTRDLQKLEIEKWPIGQDLRPART